MKTTTTFLIALGLFLIQADRCGAAANETLLKLDSIVVSDFTMYAYQYNPQGQLISEEFFVAGDSVNMIYELLYRTVHTYENGKKVSSVRWNNTSGTMQESERTVYKYEKDKLWVELYDYYFNNQWHTAKKAEYQYGTDGLLSKIEYSMLYETLFKVNEQALYQYDEQSGELLNIVNQIPMPDEQWADKTKTAFEYRDGNLISQTRYYRNDTTLIWTPTEKQEFIYDTSTPDKVTYREFEYQEADFFVSSERQIVLDNSCPAKNLILPYDNHLPYKVENETDPAAQKVSNYYYSLLVAAGLNDLDDFKDISISPNPVKDVLNIRSETTIDSVDFFDISGRLLMTYSGADQVFDLSGLAQGIYSMRVYCSGRYTVLKFIKR